MGDAVPTRQRSFASAKANLTGARRRAYRAHMHANGRADQTATHTDTPQPLFGQKHDVHAARRLQVNQPQRRST